VFVDGVLVPVKLLINGTSIVQTRRATVTYYHVELPMHAVILAERLPVESYLDVGDRANFADQDTVRLFPDFDARLAPDVAWVWETRGAAPLVVTGDILADVRRLVSTRAPRSSDISESAVRRVRE
jgi:collagen type I alpha